MGLVINEVKEDSAQWIDYPIGEGDKISFLINGLYSTGAYQVALARYNRHVNSVDQNLIAGGLKKDSLIVGSDERSQVDVQCELLGRYIIKGWKGEIIKDDVIAEYSPENAYWLLKSNLEVYLFILSQSQLVDAKRQIKVDETVGKSLNISTTKKTTAATAKSKPKSTDG
ncbi:MAG TPA: hypothetical protein VIH30_07355 [Aquirhabdus sp.]